MNLTHLFTDTISYVTQTGSTSKGVITYSTVTTVKGRVEYVNEIVVGQDGTQKRANHAIMTASEIPLGARVWFPGDSTADTAQSKRPISIKKAATFGGYTVYETYF